VLVYAVFGQARQLSVGPLATISIIAAAALAKLAPTGSSQYIAYAATLALLVGGVHVALGVARLGFLLRFLSEPVMTGFIAAVGVIIWLPARARREHAPHALHLIVRDDGAGFDVDVAAERARRGGSLGLPGMRERLSLVGGELECKSTPGQGTEVHAVLPLRSLRTAASNDEVSLK
jgi:hypothetical protein